MFMMETDFLILWVLDPVLVLYGEQDMYRLVYVVGLVNVYYMKDIANELVFEFLSLVEWSS